MIGRDEAADRTQALAEGASHEVDRRLDVLLFGGPPAIVPEHADRMRLVDQQKGAVPRLDFGELGKRRLVSEHAAIALCRPGRIIQLPQLPALQPGVRLGPYTILSALGAGGMDI